MHVLIVRGARARGAAVGEKCVRLLEEGDRDEGLVPALMQLFLAPDEADVDRVLQQSSDRIGTEGTAADGAGIARLSADQTGPRPQPLTIESLAESPETSQFSGQPPE